MLHLALLGILSFAGTIVDYATGRPLEGVPVSIAARTDQAERDLSGARVANGYITVLTDAQGRFEFGAVPQRVLITAYGETRGHVTYHGAFEKPPASLTLRLIAPNAEERHALAEMNAFRQVKSLLLHTAVSPVTFDENLMETARFWASLERNANRIGHTCAALRAPAGCIEFNTYLHALPGAMLEEFSGQNAAFDSEPSWAQSLELFENEGAYCAPAYDWRRCDDGREGSLTQTGHFKNLMVATRWVGFGKATSASGGYFAQNVL